ncbi:MAG TPA: DUF4954 domain-containing protein, partial [Chitinophagaceae bacterium]
KGDFPAELNIPIPFSLVSNDVSRDKLVVMPGYWFLYNMYALARNAGKYEGRDKRTDKTQVIEYDFLAPDSVNELFNGLQLVKQFTAKAWALKNKKIIAGKDLIKAGETLLETNPAEVSKLEILAEGFENSERKSELIRVPEAYRLFKELIVYYGISELIRFIEQKNISSWQKLLQALPGKPVRNQWKNIGGQLMPEADLHTLIRNIRSGKINSWDEVHLFYNDKSARYPADKFRHAFASLLEILKLSPSKFSKKIFRDLLQQAAGTREWMVQGIYESRAKDYSNPFRKMVYETEKEMEKVIGALKDNSFIKEQQAAAKIFSKKINDLVLQFS